MNIILFLLITLISIIDNEKKKRLPTEWEKIFAKNKFDKKLISKIYKELSIKKKKNRNTI